MTFGFWSQPARKADEPLKEGKDSSEAKTTDDVKSPGAEASVLAVHDGSKMLDAAAERAVTETSHTQQPEQATVPAPVSTATPSTSTSTSTSAPHARPERRFSWRSIVYPKAGHERKSALPTAREEAAKEEAIRREYVEHRILRSRSEKRAHQSAVVVRELIVGPFAAPSAAPPKSTKVAVKAVPSKQVQKVKAELLRPKSAKKVIAQLRQLPSSDVPVVVGKTISGEDVTVIPNGPIHAVCLPFTDSEAQEKAFCKLDKVPASAPSPSSSPKVKERNLNLASVPQDAVAELTSVTTSSFEKLKAMLADLDVVSLITVPDLGLGQPGDAPGLLSGAVPTAKAIIEGVQEITPQLMALGYATGKSILPSHAGVYPPTDRMSVITYWWGLEVVMPEPSVQYLSNVPSIAHTVVNFLTALSVANGGVREIMPFVRYISQYVDAEFNAIRDQDQGQGVVCAATWLMPAALVPRPWDFPQPPVDSKEPDGATPVPPTTSPSVPSDPATAPIMLTPPLPTTNHAPLFVGSAGTSAAQVNGSLGNPEEGVPGVTVTPPTPPASETLGKSGGGPFAPVVSHEDAADRADENGIAAFGEAGANQGVVNGAPAISVTA